MNQGKFTTFALIATILATGITFNAGAAVSVLTYQYDNTRAGANTNETILTPANVNTTTFGRLFQYTVDGYVYGQPLIVPNVTIPGQGTHDIMYIATEHDTVYAFDADTFVSTPYWTNSFISPAANIGIIPYTNTVSSGFGAGVDVYGNITPEIGITSTPVIDPVTKTIFVEARTKTVTAGNITNFYHMLHALDITTGQERPNSPVNIFATNYPGTGGSNGVINGITVPDSDGAGHVLWNSLQEANRSGLLLVNGQVYITYGEPGDKVPWHGWLFSYNETNLTQTGVICDTPNGEAGGYWMGGGAPAADTNGYIYANTGNGDYNASLLNYGDAYVKYATNGGLHQADYFVPNNQLYLESQDLDVSSSGLILLPDSVGSVAHPHLMFGGSKNNAQFLIDRDNLGQFNGASDQIVQGITNAAPNTKAVNMDFAVPAYYNGSIYVANNGLGVKAFSIANASINTNATSTSAAIFSKSATPTISANGTSNGIVWMLNIDGFGSTAAILYAYNATNLTQLLYSSSQLSSRDAAGIAVHFTAPSVANGKVYVPGMKKVSVYGNAYFFPVNAGTYNNGVYTLPMSGTPNFTYTLQATTDFQTWTNVSSNTPTSTPFNLIDTGASNYQRRFYRAVVP